ncbi:MAG TPA: PilZ domain-containing protein [Allosphingosinicella sp.]|nr:PilZ domain-containing protein [Allosphingosinicella sp.]
MAMHDRNLALAAGMITRSQERVIDQRSEERHDDVIDRAVILFRGREYLVPVVNISSRGTMIESDIAPHIGETIVVQFESCTRIHAFVRWVRDGRLGLNFGHEIVLC